MLHSFAELLDNILTDDAQLFSSSTVLDLPYRFSADDTKMRLDPRMNMEKYLGGFDVQTAFCCAMLGMLMMDLMSEDD